MAMISPDLLVDIRSKFAYIDTCPEQGPRAFFENAGGALTLKRVVETSSDYAAIPDNQGRANPGSEELVRVIERTKARLSTFMNAPGGQFFVGESGTELLFRLISTACLAQPKGGRVLGSTLEHPATRSAAARWSKIAGQDHVLVDHDNETGTVSLEAYLPHITPDTRVATLIHTSPVTGMAVDVVGIAKAIREVADNCLIIVDGIQHAAHGEIDLSAYGADGYIISPYKMFSRHGYGLAWISDHFSGVPHDCLIDGPPEQWELGTRDTGSYATMSQVIEYLDWLGAQVSGEPDGRERFVAAGQAIHAQEETLVNALVHGVDNLPGLADLDGVYIIGGADNPLREGLVCFSHIEVPASEIVGKLNAAGVRTHIRKDDHYSGNILTPLGIKAAVRVSLCHYNSLAEVQQFLSVMVKILETDA